MDSTDWDQRYREADRLWSVEPNLFVADRLKGRPPGVGVDLACGEGRNAIWLAQQGWNMTAVDFSEVAVDRGRSMSTEVDFVVADVLTWEPRQLVDLVLIAYLQLQPPELEKTIRRAREWLNVGGELFAIGHDRSNIEHGHGGPQIPEILWDVDELRSWMEGMEIIEAAVVRRPVQTDEGVVFALDALVRARAIR